MSYYVLSVKLLGLAFILKYQKIMNICLSDCLFNFCCTGGVACVVGRDQGKALLLNALKMAFFMTSFKRHERVLVRW